MATAQSAVRAAGEGEKFPAGPFAITTRVSGAQTNNLFEMYELKLGVATVDYHVHETMDETIYVIDGSVEFNVAGELSKRGVGSVAFIPRGVHHGFANHGPASATVLILFTPAKNQDAYFRELVRLFAAPKLDTAELAAVQKKFDQVLIPAGK